MQRGKDYRRHVETHLRDFLNEMGDRQVHEITLQEISAYIFDKPYSPLTKRHYKRSIGGAYAFINESMSCFASSRFQTYSR